VAGYSGINGKNHALFEDFENSTLTVIGQDSKDDTGWAGGTESTRTPRKSVAADLDGDGIDEVVIVALKNGKILIYKGVYNNSAFTITQVGDHAMPETVNDTVNDSEGLSLPLNGWALISADLNGDGKQECILTLPGTGAAYMYVLENNLAMTQIHLTPYYGGLLSGRRWFPMVTAADYDQDGKDELCLMIGDGAQDFNARYYILDDKDANYAKLSDNLVATSTVRMRVGRVKAGDFTGDGLPDTVFYGIPSNNFEQRVVMLLQTSLNNAFQPEFTWVESANKLFSGNGQFDNVFIPQFAVGDGRRQESRSSRLESSLYAQFLQSICTDFPRAPF
jgi:hypothetical protein